MKTDPATPVTPDLEQLRREYNTALANGLVLKARRIARVIAAKEAAMTPVTPEAEPLRDAIGRVIDRWYKARLLYFNSRDDGSDDLLLRDEIWREVRAASPDRPEPGLRAALEGLDAVFGWIEQEHRKVLVEMPTELFRRIDVARDALRATPEPGWRAALEQLQDALTTDEMFRRLRRYDRQSWDNEVATLVEVALRASPDRLAGGLDEAWTKAEAALPEPDGWKLRLIWHPQADEPEKYAYEARYDRSTYDWRDEPPKRVGRGGTPAAALRALADRLSGLTEEGT